jgi:hypothetical protein
MAFASFLTWLKLPGNILIVHDNAAIDDCTRLPIDEKEHEAFSRWANSSADRLPDHLSLVPSSSTARRLDNHGSKRRDLDLGSNHDLSPRFPNLNLPARNTSYVNSPRTTLLRTRNRWNSLAVGRILALTIVALYRRMCPAHAAHDDPTSD